MTFTPSLRRNKSTADFPFYELISAEMNNGRRWGDDTRAILSRLSRPEDQSRAKKKASPIPGSDPVKRLDRTEIARP